MQAARYGAASRRHRTFVNGKIPVARPGRHSVEFRLVRAENGRYPPCRRRRSPCLPAAKNVAQVGAAIGATLELRRLQLMHDEHVKADQNRRYADRPGNVKQSVALDALCPSGNPLFPRPLESLFILPTQ